MIRLIISLLFLFPSLSFAACVSGQNWSGTLALLVGTSPAIVTINGDTYDVVTATPGAISVDGQWQQYTGTWTCATLPPPPDPILCPDGSAPPNGDLAQCPVTPPNPPDPLPAPTDPGAQPNVNPYGSELEIASQRLMQQEFWTRQVLEEVRGAINNVNQTIISAKDYLAQRIGEISQQATASITNAISQQTQTLSSNIAGVASAIANMSQNMSTKLDQANVYLNQITANIAALGTNINEAAAQITDGITAQTQELITGLTDVRNAVSSGAAWMVSAVTEGGVNTVNAIRDLHDTVTTGLADISGYLNDAAVNAENSLTSLANISSAIAQLPSQIANAIVTNEGFGAGAASIVQAFNDGVTSLTTSLTDIYDSIDSMSGDLIRYGDSIYSKLDDLTTKAADFFAGTPSAMSDKGSAILNEPLPDNPLATPEEVNLDSMLSTTVSGGGGCPAPVSVDVLGGTLYFRYDMLCEWAETVGKLIMILASILSLRIIAKD